MGELISSVVLDSRRNSLNDGRDTNQVKTGDHIIINV